MTGTPDAHHGELLEDEGILLSPSTDPTVAGEIRYSSGALKAKDGTGVFGLRDVSLHAPTHKKLGTDSLNAQDLGSGAAVAGKLLQTDGAGGWNLVDYVPGMPPNLNSGEYTTPFSTSSGTYQPVWTFTTPSLPAGSYFIAAIAMLDTSNAGNVTDARIQLDDVTIIGSWIAPVGYVGGSTPLIGLRSVTLTAGVHHFDFDIRKVSGNGNVIMKSCYITIWRVA